MHHIAECLLMAHYLDKTMVYNSTGLEYNKTAGFTDILEPFSETCIETPSDEKEEYYPEGNYSYKRISYIDEWTRYKLKTNYTARRIPEELASRLEKLSNDPVAWWNGLLLDLSIKYAPKVSREIEKFMQNFSGKSPIVAVQVRRTDKPSDIAFSYELEGYMKHVDEYFDQLELTQKVERRRIYLATEVPDVVIEAKQKYPHYEILSNIEGAKISQHRNETRWSTEGLIAIAIDIYMLSQCDFAVCTLSSNICRIVLEYFQVRFPDTTNKLVSMDNLYYADYEYYRSGVSTLKHSPIFNGEIELEKGDSVQVFYNNNTHGYYKVENLRTQEKGFVPAYKIKIIAETYKAKSIF